MKDKEARLAQRMNTGFGTLELTTAQQQIRLIPSSMTVSPGATGTVPHFRTAVGMGRDKRFHLWASSFHFLPHPGQS